jgi:hypothetical protein
MSDFAGRTYRLKDKLVTQKAAIPLQNLVYL